MAAASSRVSPRVQITGLLVALVICYIAAYLGQLATTPNLPTWYAELSKPAFNPPNAVFPIVWGILYTLMAVAAWLVWRSPRSARRRLGLGLFAIQLALNVAWPWAFFGAQNPILGAVVIVPLVFAIAATAWAFWKVDKIASALLVPYLAWGCFATLLNVSIAALN